MSEVLSYLSSKGFDYKPYGKDEVVIVCPECGKQKLSINIISGKAVCWVCHAKDSSLWTVDKCHINKIMEHFGDTLRIKTPKDLPKLLGQQEKEEKERPDFTELALKNHKALLENPQALKFLFKRGITEESVIQFNLGYEFMYNTGWISIPSFENGIARMIKYRQLPPIADKLAKYIRKDGGESVLFNGDVMSEYDEIYLCEGELDAITLIQNGYPNTVGVTVGAGTLLPEWYDKLNMMSKIYLIFDNDKVGQDSARNVYATRLGMDRCWNVTLPEDADINDFFNTYEKEDFESFLKAARRFSIDGVMDISQVISNMYRQSTEQNNEIETPWPAVNKLMGGGLKKRHLTVVGGQAGTGKTTFALQIAYHLGTKYNIPSFVFCLEMSEVDLLVKIIQLKFDLTYNGINFSDAYMYGREIEKLPILFGYKSNIKKDVYRNTVRQVRDKYGCSFFIFDNLHRWIVSDREADYSDAVKFFKDLAMDYEIMMMMVAQPRKLNDNSAISPTDNHQYLPTYDDLKGSSAIGQDADEVVLLHRRRVKDDISNRSFEKKTHIINDKARFASGGNCFLHFEPDKSRFYNITDPEYATLYRTDIERMRKNGTL